MLVELMNELLACWKNEGMDVESLFRQSRIWDMGTQGKVRSLYNPRAYCSQETLLRHIRWERVLASADFVLQNCELNMKLLNLVIKHNKLRSLLSSHK